MNPWADEADLACSPDDPTSVLLAASEVLWVRSGRQFGTRTVTVRPCVGDGCSSWGAPWSRHGWPTGAPSACSCSGSHTCGAGASEIRLGIGPLLDVTRVMVNGTEVPESEREVQEGEWLVYLADSAGQARAWPTAQRLDRPDTEDQTFSVTTEVGVAVPELGRLAALELACKLSELVPDGSTCDPSNATRMVKDGVTYELISFAEALVNAKAIPLGMVALFVDTYNPKGLQRRSRVLFPPSPLPRRVDSVGS